MAEAINHITIPSFVYKKLTRLKSKNRISYGGMIDLMINHWEEIQVELEKRGIS